MVNQRKYDMSNSKRIYNLIVLKGKCLKYDNELMLDCANKFDLPFEVSYNTFFSAMSDAIDNMLFFFLNDEVSASLENRGPLGDILACSLKEHGSQDDDEYIRLSCSDVQNLFSNRTDFIIGSYFLDFTVGTFSVFEKWMCVVYDEVRQRKKSKNSKVKKLKKFISSYNQCDEHGKEKALQQIMNNCSSYVSSAEKIDFVISLLNDSYIRDKERDKEVIKMYRSKRNTIHNLGVHIHASMDVLNINDIDIRLDKDEPSFTKDYNSIIYLCDELVEIYKAITKDLNLCNSESYFKS